MDSSARLVFTTDLKAQLATLERIVLRLQARAQGLTADDPVRMESAAYQVHNLYNAIEDLLKLVATHFENNISESARWHSALLQRMLQEVPGIRPAVISMDTYVALNQLRGFRHFFRHAYEIPIQYEQLVANIRLAETVVPRLEQDIQTFLQALT